MKRFLVSLALATAGAAAAQSSSAAPTCWRARPLAQCRTWIVTEAAVEMPVSSTSLTNTERTTRDYNTRLAFTLGVMANRGPSSAQGITVSMVDGDLPGRIEWRYRRWFPDTKTGVDVGLGAIGSMVRDARGWDTDRTAGLTASAGISTMYIGGDARLDVARTASGRMTHGTYLTVRTGSRAAAIATATGFALLIGLYVALSGGSYS